MQPQHPLMRSSLCLLPGTSRTCSHHLFEICPHFLASSSCKGKHRNRQSLPICFVHLQIFLVSVTFPLKSSLFQAEVSQSALLFLLWEFPCLDSEGHAQQMGQDMVLSHFGSTLFFRKEFVLCFHKALTEKKENMGKHSFFMLTFPSFEIKGNTLKAKLFLY